MKWINVIILAVVGVIAAVVAVEYLTQPIHSVPSILGGHNVPGHFHKRGYLALVIAIVALAGAVKLAVGIQRSAPTDTGSSAPQTPAEPAPETVAANSVSAEAPAPASAASTVPAPAPQPPTDGS